MRKPIKLVSSIPDEVFSFGTTFSPTFGSFTMISGAQPDWNETNPASPSYIKNKEIAEQYRPITVNGEEMLDETRESGPLQIKSGTGVVLEIKDGVLVISSEATEDDKCDCPDYIEGKGIDIVDGEDGDKVISIEPNSVDDEMISGVSVEKLFQNEGGILILNGGSN